eukprot:scaffold374534_cov18-Prasinocladus_malaysianus.AAC.2
MRKRLRFECQISAVILHDLRQDPRSRSLICPCFASRGAYCMDWAAQLLYHARRCDLVDDWSGGTHGSQLDRIVNIHGGVGTNKGCRLRRKSHASMLDVHRIWKFVTASSLTEKQASL